MSVRSTVLSAVEQVAEEQDIALPPLGDDLILLDSGLDSLAIAIVVARLEDTLGFDAFSASGEIAYPVTVGDFVRLYEHAAERSGASASGSARQYA
jgi:hypothetical protein